MTKPPKQITFVADFPVYFENLERLFYDLSISRSRILDLYFLDIGISISPARYIVSTSTEVMKDLFMIKDL